MTTPSPTPTPNPPTQIIFLSGFYLICGLGDIVIGLPLRKYYQTPSSKDNTNITSVIMHFKLVYILDKLCISCQYIYITLQDHRLAASGIWRQRLGDIQ